MAKYIKLQLNGTAGMAERCTGGKTDLPLITFRSGEETSAGLSSSELSQAGVAKEEKKKRARRDKNRTIERQRGCDLCA